MKDKTKRFKDTPNRAQFYDYSAPGKYYITICTSDREHLFGKIENYKMFLSPYGEIVANEIITIPEYHKRVILDEWIIMPDHIHLIIELGDWNFNNGVSIIGDDDVVMVNQMVGTVGQMVGTVGQIHEFDLPSSPPQSKFPETTPYRPQNPSIEQIKQYRKDRRKMIIFKILGKMKISKEINILRNTPGASNWQSDYYDHVIRTNDEYLRIKKYIQDNVNNWKG